MLFSADISFLHVEFFTLKYKPVPMKKILLLGFVAAGSISFVNGQASFSDYGTQIGQTYYDLQSNYSTGNRIVRHADGTISAVWTESCESDPTSCDENIAPNGCNYVNRGAGYNFFDGSQWVYGPDGTCDEPGGTEYGIFPVRAGWPEIISLPSGKEMVFAHASTGNTLNPTTLQTVSRPQFGQGDMSSWTHSGVNLFTPATFTNTWPRVVSSGTTIHMVATCQPCTTRRVIGPIRYFRSTNEGATWDKIDVELPGIDTPFFSNIGADGYAIHANGQHVAIIAGGTADDWAMWKSDNNGETWVKKTITHFDGAADTVDLGLTYPVYETTDQFMSVVVDKNGLAHAFAGHSVIAIDPDTMKYNNRYYPGLGNGIVYWNENMGPDSLMMAVNGIEDIYPAGHEKDYIAGAVSSAKDDFSPFAAGMVNMPAAAVDANNNLYLVYSALLEGSSLEGDSTGQAYRDLYITRFMVGDTNAWAEPINIPLGISGQRSEFEDNVFPSVVKDIANDEVIHVVWQNDYTPGLHVRIDFDEEELNRIMYAPIGLDRWPDIFNVLSAPEEVSYASNITVAPNPTNTGLANVNLTLDRAAKVGVKVTNILGQEVYNVPAMEKPVGPSSIMIDLSAQPAGIYIYSVVVDGVAKTQRLVKE